MVKISVEQPSIVEFPFEKYCGYILSVLPKKDLLGLKEIKFVTDFSAVSRENREAMAWYCYEQKSNSAHIEVNVKKLIKNQIPEYLFNFYRDIAALLLAEIVAHEIGHHVHTFHRHGIKKKRRESFADQYSKAGYFHYLKFRRRQIIFSYRFASLNVFKFDHDARQSFSSARKEIIKWLRENENGIPFP